MDDGGLVQGRAREAATVTPDLTDDAIVTALRAFLLAVLPDGVEVVQGQVNRVPEPASPDHVIITAAKRTQLSTTVHRYVPTSGDSDNALGAQPLGASPARGGFQRTGRSNSLTYQLDVYGPNSNDNAQVIATLFRDDYGCAFLALYGVQPLYCDDGQQMPLVNGEYQYEDRWTMSVVLQGNPYVSVPAQFADKVRVDMQEVI